MKKLFILFALAMPFLSCKKNNNTAELDVKLQAAADDAAIQTYLTNNKITAQKDASGLYYEIVTPGSGTNPTATSKVEVQYTGKLLNGTVFGTSNGSSNFVADLNGGVIKGWTIGVPYVKPGGRINLYIPSALGYGDSSPTVGIPNNSVLIFTIDLVRVQ